MLNSCSDNDSRFDLNSSLLLFPTNRPSCGKQEALFVRYGQQMSVQSKPGFEICWYSLSHKINTYGEFQIDIMQRSKVTIHIFSHKKGEMIKKRGEIKEEDHGNFARVDPKETIYLLALADKEDSGVNLTAKFVEVRLPNSVIALLIGCFIIMILLLTLCSIMIGVICKQCSRVVMEQNDSNLEPPNIEVQERVKSNMDNESQVESPPFTRSKKCVHII
ncbi:unnamed protein product [Moneuplotes crassus]|uniref:Uncharacterized protein n=1 Tax=Euplotes crassus TaxID=5936 RepID=A0AAD1XBK2_EUPCR|nr:unnamed protein product [Moneuplotes crassus]